MTMFATGNTTQSSSGTSNASSLIFRGEGVASIGITGGSVVVSVPAGGGGLTNIRISAGTTSNLLSDVTFANSNGVTFGLNASTITASVAAAGGVTYSGYRGGADDGNERVVGQQGQGTFFVQPMWNAPNFQFDQFVLPVQFSAATNSSNSFTVSFFVGLYTRNASTLSLLMSSTASRGVTLSGTVGSYSLFAGQRNFTFPWTTTVSASDYWLGIGSRTTTGGGAGMTLSQWLASQPNSVYSGNFAEASNATKGGNFGQGFFSATTAAVPGSIAFTQINASGSLNARPPIFWMNSASV